MEPIHEGLENVALYDKSKMTDITICLDSGRIATAACANDPRGDRTEKVLVYHEDVPGAKCTKHVMVDFCSACGCAANEYCLKLATYTDLVIERKGLVKMTQAEMNEIRAAEGKGLNAIYLRDNYVYFINDDGTDGAFHGFHGNINSGVQLPYMLGI